MEQQKIRPGGVREEKFLYLLSSCKRLIISITLFVNQKKISYIANRSIAQMLKTYFMKVHKLKWIHVVLWFAHECMSLGMDPGFSKA